MTRGSKIILAAGLLTGTYFGAQAATDPPLVEDTLPYAVMEQVDVTPAEFPCFYEDEARISHVTPQGVESFCVPFDNIHLHEN